MIPAEWTIEPLESLIDYDTGRTPARANSVYWEGDGRRVPWVAISDMENYGTILKTRESITQRAFDEVFRNRIVRAGTLLMSFKLTIGRVSTLGIDACHNEAIISIHPKQRVDQRYLGYFLSQVDYDDHQDRQIKGNTLNQDKINRIPVMLPPKGEQSTIADVLDRAREAIALEIKAEEVASALKRAAMRELFTRGLRGEPQKETEIGLVPESWEVAPLANLASIERGRFLHRPRNEPRFYGGSTPFVQTGDVVRSAGRIREFSQSLNDDGVAISRVFPAGTILITIAANIGYTGILQFASACPDSLVAITPHSRIENAFLEYFLQTQQAEMDRRAPKGTQKNINIQFLSPWPVPVPEIKEQQEVVEILNALDRKIDLHKRKCAVLEDLFKALLHKLMTGEIRVSDLDLPALGQASDLSGANGAGPRPATGAAA